MKELYNTRMKEYVTELTFISEKLIKYEELITKKYYFIVFLKFLINKKIIYFKKRK